MGRKINNLMELSILNFRLSDSSVQNLFNYSMDIASFCNSIFWWSGTFSLGGEHGRPCNGTKDEQIASQLLTCSSFCFHLEGHGGLTFATILTSVINMMGP